MNIGEELNRLNQLYEEAKYDDLFEFFENEALDITHLPIQQQFDYMQLQYATYYRAMQLSKAYNIYKEMEVLSEEQLTNEQIIVKSFCSYIGKYFNADLEEIKIELLKGANLAYDREDNRMYYLCMFRLLSLYTHQQRFREAKSGLRFLVNEAMQQKNIDENMIVVLKIALLQQFIYANEEANYQNLKHELTHTNIKILALQYYLELVEIEAEINSPEMDVYALKSQLEQLDILAEKQKFAELVLYTLKLLRKVLSDHVDEIKEENETPAVNEVNSPNKLTARLSVSKQEQYVIERFKIASKELIGITLFLLKVKNYSSYSSEEVEKYINRLVASSRAYFQNQSVHFVRADKGAIIFCVEDMIETEAKEIAHTFLYTMIKQFENEFIVEYGYVHNFLHQKYEYTQAYNLASAYLYFNDEHSLQMEHLTK